METRAIRKVNPVEHILCTDRLPTAWCSGCGIGTVVYSFLEALGEAGLAQGRILLLTGSGCTGNVADYLRLRSRRAKRKYLVDEAADMQLGDPDHTYVVFMNNADLLISGAEDIARAIKRKARMLIIHINNIIYIKRKDGPRANTPFTRRSRDGGYELPFNMPGLLISYGANFVARWTPLQAGWLRYSIGEAFLKNGVSYIEVVSPCLVYEADLGIVGDAVKKIGLYDKRSVVNSGTSLDQFDIRESGRIVIGNLFDGGAR
jgi:2-oxoglutarate ferredoxin oxidoreductase subunit beta